MVLLQALLQGCGSALGRFRPCRSPKRLRRHRRDIRAPDSDSGVDTVTFEWDVSSADQWIQRNGAVRCVLTAVDVQSAPTDPLFMLPAVRSGDEDHRLPKLR